MTNIDNPTKILSAVCVDNNDSSQPSGLSIAQLRALLRATNPFCDDDTWDHILLDIHHKSGGSDDGLALADEWCRLGDNHPGAEALASKWQSFGDTDDDTVTIDAIRASVEGHGFDFDEICRQALNDCAQCEDAAQSPRPENPLEKFSLKGMHEQLEKEAIKQDFALEPLALMGQATVIFGQSNIGKSLIIQRLSAIAASQGVIDPARLCYFNADDSQAGVLDKLEYADEFGYHTIAEGHQGFSAGLLQKILNDLVTSKQAKDVIIILDTGKSFYDPMSKREGRKFGKYVRRFVINGGTVIVLAHTNKYRDSEGKPIYAGTTDIVEDFDCAYLLYEVGIDADTETRTVQFENIKNRGKVARQICYRYSIAEDVTYREILDSVEPIDQTEADSLKQASELESDSPVIEAIAQCIGEGINTKIALAQAAAKRSGASKRTALRILEKYTGSDPERHQWDYAVHERGAMKYRLLTPIKAGTDPVS
jgi:hypothetical protein